MSNLQDTPRLYFGYDDTEMTLTIGGKNFELDEGLIYELVRVVKRHSYFEKCKNCEKPFIVNSANHVICFRCKKKPGDEEL